VSPALAPVFTIVVLAVAALPPLFADATFEAVSWSGAVACSDFAPLLAPAPRFALAALAAASAFAVLPNVSMPETAVFNTTCKPPVPLLLPERLLPPARRTPLDARLPLPPTVSDAEFSSPVLCQVPPLLLSLASRPSPPLELEREDELPPLVPVPCAATLSPPLLLAASSSRPEDEPLRLESLPAPVP
jgi:hypothetical protein